MSDLAQLDQQISLWINSLGTGGSFDQFWIFMSEKVVWVPLYALIAVLMIWKLGWKKGLIAIAAVALAFFFNERINNLIKHLAERTRPCNDESMLAAGIRVLKHTSGFSFPSGHACNCFGLAASSVFFLKFKLNLYGAFIFIWASLVGISRIMLANHFLGDVLVGALTGSLVGIIMAIIAKRIMAKVK